MEALREKFGHLRGITLNALAPARGKLMDFGSGAGHFAAAQAKLGWDVVALDPYSSASNAAQNARVSENHIELLYPDNSFDAITLWYVIEHLQNPAQALEEFYRVLKPNGILVLAQQDFGSLQARMFGQNWLFLDPPRHLWQFTASSLEALAAQKGFALKTVSWATLEMSPFCMLQSALNVIVGNNNDLFKFLKNNKLPKDSKGYNSARARPWAVLASVALLPVLGPLTLLAYFVLLAFKQGDIFTLYLEKRP
ncbi:MAG: methyltransferase domain-containing protein [Alphaproteobacteria bacterium]|nr:methyltransferase domain-containing protein [Alphaproteobacteria bacterium]